MVRVRRVTLMSVDDTVIAVMVDTGDGVEVQVGPAALMRDLAAGLAIEHRLVRTSSETWARTEAQD